MEPLLQYVQTSINGKSIRNQSLGYPHSPATSLPLYYENSEEWKRVPLYSNLKGIEIRKFKLGESSDAAEAEVVVFPRGFRYEYQYSSEERCYNGLNVFADYTKKEQRLNIKEIRIDKNIASPELWKSLTCGFSTISAALAKVANASAEIKMIVFFIDIYFFC